MANVPYDPEVARQLLAASIAQQPPPLAVPLPVSDWVGMSCLQKGIRRANESLALRAAATLLESKPDRLWRRCAGISFEEVGVADLKTISLVMAALTGKRYRADVGGDWAVASFIVSAMSRASKCRASDDLMMAVELHPRLERARSDLATLSTSDLLHIATGSSSLFERAIAAWYAAGTYWRTTRHLLPRRGEPQLLFDHLKSQDYPSALVDLAREGYRKGAAMLAPLVAMLSLLHHVPVVTENDQFPPENMIGDVTGWALDLYSREGRACLEAFLGGGSAAAVWVRAHIAPPQRLRFLGGVLFRVEGGLVRQRLRWPIGDKLRRMMDVECHGPHCPDATEILNLMRADLPQLNEVRRHAW